NLACSSLFVKSTGLQDLLHENHIQATGAHIGERVPHRGMRYPGSHPTEKEIGHFLVELLPDCFDLAGRAQVPLNRRVTYRPVLRASYKMLEPLTHKISPFLIRENG